jgi:trans-aconitate 2-methyltransferase
MTRDWDAGTYHRVSTPQLEWAREVIERLPLDGDETVLDAGCGSGRVTQLLLERLPAGRVVGVDASRSMVEKAREALGPDVELHVSDLTELELPEQVDAVFSNAVFHWVPDHDALFKSMYAALKPGGRMVVQCGGQGNIERFHAVLHEVAKEPPFAEHIGDWQGPWNFADPASTALRLENAGFEDVDCWLHPAPVVPDEPEPFIQTVCLGHHLERLPEELRPLLVKEVAERCGDPLTLDYVRLNIDARRPE